MSRKKGRYPANAIDDELRKELARELWYNIQSEIRKLHRPAGVIKGLWSFSEIK